MNELVVEGGLKHEPPWLIYCRTFPPSVNAMWRAYAGRGGMVRTILSERGRKFREEVADAVDEARGFSLPPEPLDGELDVVIELYQPDRRRRDVDNYCKGIFDALTHAQVWHDDSQVRAMKVTKHEPDGLCRGWKILINPCE